MRQKSYPEGLIQEELKSLPALLNEMTASNDAIQPFKQGMLFSTNVLIHTSPGAQPEL